MAFGCLCEVEVSIPVGYVLVKSVAYFSFFLLLDLTCRADEGALGEPCNSIFELLTSCGWMKTHRLPKRNLRNKLILCVFYETQLGLN